MNLEGVVEVEQVFTFVVGNTTVDHRLLRGVHNDERQLYREAGMVKTTSSLILYATSQLTATIRDTFDSVHVS